jgi:cytidylate kinase
MVAERLGWLYLDTGAMYRAVALKVLRGSIPLSDTQTIVRLAGEARIDLVHSSGGYRVLLDGVDVSSDIRTPEVDRAVGPVCEIPGVREVLVPRQRAFAEKGNLITDGRDQGTVVFPDADLKFFVTASIDERARRRRIDQEARGVTLPLDTIASEIEARDKRDSERVHSPLRSADDAVLLDTTGMTVERQVGVIVEAVRRKMGDGHAA